MRNVFAIPFDATESRVAEAMMGLVDDEAEQFGEALDRGVLLGGGATQVHDLGSEISAAMVGAYCADEF